MVPFWGTRLDLDIRPGDYRAFLFVDVDGQPANALPRDEGGRAYIVLYDPQGQVRTVTLAEGLSEGNHLARITAERGWGQWAIAGWTVSRHVPLSARTWLALGLSCAALLVFGVVLVGAWRQRRSALSACHLLASRYRALLTIVVLPSVTHHPDRVRALVRHFDAHGAAPRDGTASYCLCPSPLPTRKTAAGQGLFNGGNPVSLDCGRLGPEQLARACGVQES